MPTDRYDEALIQILQAEGKIVPFLDVIFGFLQRRTDFFHEHSQPSSVGFPPGVAEQLVVTTLRKWRQIQLNSTAPPAVAEEEVVTSPAGMTSSSQTSSAGMTSSSAGGGSQDTIPAAAAATGDSVKTKLSPTTAGSASSAYGNPSAPRGDSARGEGDRGGGSADTHNGAARDNYSWSQTISDLTVQVPVPSEVRRARQVSVQLRNDRASVHLTGGKELMSGRLHRPIRADESTWSLLPGDCVQLSLEKGRECWWKSLLEEEPEIDMAKIEAVKPWEDLSEEEQMKVNELRAREEAKRRPETAPVAAAGGQRDVSALLREAWDAEGSPFRGQPYDPGTVQVIPDAAATGLATDGDNSGDSGGGHG